MKLGLYIKRLFTYLKNGDPKINIKVCSLSSSEKLKGKNIIVTGGSKGLGYSIAKKCSEEGANVIITGRNENDLSEAAKKIVNCKYFVLDMNDNNSFNNIFDSIGNYFPSNKVDAIVNNAGISLHEKGILDVTTTSWEKQFNTNLKGTYFFTQAYLNYIMSHNQEAGNILMISSERGLAGDTIPYGLTKSAINNFVQGLSKKYIKEGIRVNGIAPGVTASNMTGFSNNSNMYRPEAIGLRVFLPEEVAEVACFLLSDASNCISGEIIACDQGNYLSRNWEV